LNFHFILLVGAAVSVSTFMRKLKKIGINTWPYPKRCSKSKSCVRIDDASTDGSVRRKRLKNIVVTRHVRRKRLNSHSSSQPKESRNCKAKTCQEKETHFEEQTTEIQNNNILNSMTVSLCKSYRKYLHHKHLYRIHQRLYFTNNSHRKFS